MKLVKPILSLLFAAATIGVSAQYCPTTEGSTAKYTSHLIEADKTMSMTAVVTKVAKGDDGVTTVTCEQTIDVPGALITIPKAYEYYKFTTPEDPTVIVSITAEDYKSQTVDMIVEGSKAQGRTPTEQQIQDLKNDIRTKGELTLTINPKAAEGDKLPASTLRLDIGEQMMTVSNNNGKFLGKEEVTVPAGTFECVKLAYTKKENTPDGINKTYETVWYAPGVGLVKDETKDKKGNLISNSELIEFKK